MNPAQRIAIEQIDALLPQTQCGQCGHPGCRPYAEAITQGTPINQCPPGGNETIAALAQLLNCEILPLNPEHGEIATMRKVAYIREAECIGCTKCIQACPVDAILGAAKLMHTVIVEECTGCDLCVEPCPVDCIDMIPIAPAHPETPAAQEAAKQLANHWRSRFEFHNQRLTQIQAEKTTQRKISAIGLSEHMHSTLSENQQKLQRYKSAYVMTLKQWKDAERALQHVLKQPSPTKAQQAQIAQYQTQVEQLKQAADIAKKSFDQIKQPRS